MTGPGALAQPLHPLRDRPGDTALFLDYDGTLAPIVLDPAGALPLPEVPALLGRLARRLALVAVVSGRPVHFLVEALGRPSGVHLAGIYGMEEQAADGSVRYADGADAWRPIVAEAVRQATADAPPGAEIEEKGLSMALHWRRAPQAEAWALETARRQTALHGLVAVPGRMAVELRPPIEADKGTVVGRLGAGFGVVGCFGDDVGDLPAFAALDVLAARGVTVARVAVADDESPPEVAQMADVVVQGPHGAVEVLRALAGD